MLPRARMRQVHLPAAKQGLLRTRTPHSTPRAHHAPLTAKQKLRSYGRRTGMPVSRQPMLRAPSPSPHLVSISSLSRLYLVAISPHPRCARRRVAQLHEAYAEPTKSLSMVSGEIRSRCARPTHLRHISPHAPSHRHTSPPLNTQLAFSSLFHARLHRTGCALGCPRHSPPAQLRPSVCRVPLDRFTPYSPLCAHIQTNLPSFS